MLRSKSEETSRKKLVALQYPILQTAAYFTLVNIVFVKAAYFNHVNIVFVKAKATWHYCLHPNLNFWERRIKHRGLKSHEMYFNQSFCVLHIAEAYLEKTF